MITFEDVHRRIEAIRLITANPQSLNEKLILGLANQMLKTLLQGNKIAFVGNGGSAAEAMHLAAEFTGKCVIDHRPLAAICLNESQSAITAIANDYGVEHIFSRQVEALLRKDDLLIGLSTSGKSRNIINALEKASDMGVQCNLWMGDFEFSTNKKISVWNVPSKSTPRIQEIHLMWGHILAELVEEMVNVHD
jgi:D-sedoheptulose 7-phosphate isomerase